MPKITPIFCSVKQAAEVLNISTWLMYRKLDNQEIPSQYEGRIRKIRYSDLEEYATNLPTTPPQPAVDAS